MQFFESGFIGGHNMPWHTESVALLILLVHRWTSCKALRINDLTHLVQLLIIVFTYVSLPFTMVILSYVKCVVGCPHHRFRLQLFMLCSMQLFAENTLIIDAQAMHDKYYTNFAQC